MVKTIKPRLQDLTKKLKSIKAKDIMSTEVVSTSEQATLAEIAELMVRTRISGLPVLDKKEKVVGVITATDLFIVMDMIKFGNVVENHMQTVSNPTARFAMSTNVIKVKESTTLDEIISMTKYHNAHTLLVFRKGKLMGIIGRHDIFKNFYAAVKALNNK
ncbi:CBS domain-containing protein [Candidatus Omnitrophota bacterium]